MNDLFLKIMGGCIVALFVWLLKMWSDQRKFRMNCLTGLKEEIREFGVTLARIDERLKGVEGDITTINRRFENCGQCKKAGD